VRRGRHPVGAPQVDGADLAADRPDRVEGLRAQQRGVAGDFAVEQRGHVGAERRARHGLGVRQVALGHVQVQQVAEVVALVGPDKQDPGRRRRLRHAGGVTAAGASGRSSSA
jgi:hypothetical protein